MGVLFPPDIIPLAFAPNHQMRPEHFGLFGWVAQSLFRHPSRHPRSMLTVHPTSDGSARLSARLQWSRFPHRIASPSSAPTSPYHHRNSPAITLSTSPPLPPLPNLVSPFAAREERERESSLARAKNRRGGGGGRGEGERRHGEEPGVQGDAAGAAGLLVRRPGRHRLPRRRHGRSPSLGLTSPHLPPSQIFGLVFFLLP